MIRRTARGTAAGPDEWQTEHYKAMAEEFCRLDDGDCAISELARYGALFAQGKLRKLPDWE